MRVQLAFRITVARYEIYIKFPLQLMQIKSYSLQLKPHLYFHSFDFVTTPTTTLITLGTWVETGRLIRISQIGYEMRSEKGRN